MFVISDKGRNPIAKDLLNEFKSAADDRRRKPPLRHDQDVPFACSSGNDGSPCDGNNDPTSGSCVKETFVSPCNSLSRPLEQIQFQNNFASSGQDSGRFTRSDHDPEAPTATTRFPEVVTKQSRNTPSPEQEPRPKAKPAVPFKPQNLLDLKTTPNTTLHATFERRLSPTTAAREMEPRPAIPLKVPFLSHLQNSSSAPPSIREKNKNVENIQEPDTRSSSCSFACRSSCHIYESISTRDSCLEDGEIPGEDAADGEEQRSVQADENRRNHGEDCKEHDPPHEPRYSTQKTAESWTTARPDRLDERTKHQIVELVQGNGKMSEGQKKPPPSPGSISCLQNRPLPPAPQNLVSSPAKIAPSFCRKTSTTLQLAKEDGRLKRALLKMVGMAPSPHVPERDGEHEIP